MDVHPIQSRDTEKQQPGILKAIGKLAVINLICMAAFLRGLEVARLGWVLQEKGVTTSGTVVKVYHRHPFKMGWPTVAFEVNGKTYKVEVRTNLRNYQIGEQVMICYDPVDPNLAQIDNNDRWKFSAYWISIGVCLALFFDAFAFLAWRRGRFNLMANVG